MPPVEKNEATITLNFGGAEQGSSPTVIEGLDERQVQVSLNRVERGERKPGRLVQVELRSSVEESASFRVARSDDNRSVLAEAELGSQTHRGRVLPVRNRSAAQLLSREMEILCNDQISRKQSRSRQR